MDSLYYLHKEKTQKTGDREMINEIKSQIRVVKHQIQATENLIKTYKIKSYVDQLIILESKLEQPFQESRTG